MKPEELAKELDEAVLRPAYLLVGSEALLRDEAIARLRAQVLGEGPVDFNFDRLDGERAEPGDLMSSVNALPVMAPQRLVLLREPEARRGARARKLTETLADAVASLREQKETVLVVTAEKADKRLKWVKAFSREPAVVVACDPPKDARASAAFARAEAKRRGMKLERGVAEALAEATGPHLLLLRSELEKLSLLAGPGETVTREQVAQSAHAVAEKPVWDLTDAIGEGRSADALQLLNQLLDGGAAAPVLLAILAGHFRKLLRVRSGERISGAPFMVRKLEQQARRYRVQRLRVCLGFIHDLDEILKGRGGLSGEISLERLVIVLAA